MIQVKSSRPLNEIEPAIALAAQRHNGSILATTHLGELLHDSKRNAIVFTVCQSDLYRALLSADVRFAAFLPCRIAALSHGDEVLLEAVSPAEFCRLLNRSDLDRLTLPLERTLREIMEEVAAPRTSRVAAASAGKGNPWGATEDQVNMRMTVPARVDCHGTKIEDLAGTGKPETLGG